MPPHAGQADWRPQSVGPDLERSMSPETLATARESILAAFGVLPSMFSPSATGPVIREGQRHLATWQLAPIPAVIAEEASIKLGARITLNVHRPLQSWDAGGRARAVAAIAGALAEAKAAEIDPDAAVKLIG